MPAPPAGAGHARVSRILRRGASLTTTESNGRSPSSVRAIVTGAGGPAGVAVIRALRGLGHHSIGADADATAAGLRLADESAVIPAADDPTFVTRVCDLARNVEADLLISTVTEEMETISRASGALDAVGLVCWIPDADAIATCRDKWLFACVCRRAGVAVPATALGLPHGVPGPWVVKPRFGRGSRDVYFVDEGEDFSWPLRRVSEPLWQSRLFGREFTVDVLVGRDGALAGAVPRWRHQVKAGISVKGSTFVDEVLISEVERLVTVIGIRGAANIQGFVTDSDRRVFVEVNPRFSGGLPLTLAAGSDLVGEYVQGALGRPLRPERLTFRPRVTMSRYLDEVLDG